MSATVDLPRVTEGSRFPSRSSSPTSTALEDTLFRGGVRAAGYFVLLLLFLIGLFLFLQGYPAFEKAGLRFFTSPGSRRSERIPPTASWPRWSGPSRWPPWPWWSARPVAIAAALFLSEYAPAWSRRSLIALVDLAAAIPSIIFGLWAVFELAEQRGRVQHLAVPPPGLHPLLQGDEPAAQRLDLHRRPGGGDHDRPHRGLDLPGGVLPGSGRRARSRAGPGGQPLADDPDGRPPLRPGRHHRRGHARAWAGPGGDDRRIDHPRRRVRLSLHILQHGGSTISQLIADHVRLGRHARAPRTSCSSASCSSPSPWSST